MTHFIKVRGYRKDQDRSYMIRITDISSVVSIQDGAKIMFYRGKEDLFVSTTVDEIFEMVQNKRNGNSQRRDLIESVRLRDNDTAATA